MDNLIRRLEAATGPDHRLDGEIFRATNPEGKWWKFDGVWCRQDPNDTVAYDLPPSFTASIDAALTLVPEGWSWDVGIVHRDHLPAPLAYARVADDRDGIEDAGKGAGGVEGIPTTAPVALCIAALIARQSAQAQKQRAADPKTGDPP